MSTQHEVSCGEETERLDVLGRKYDVTVSWLNRKYYVDSRGHELRTFGYSKVHAMSNMCRAIVCLNHIEARKPNS